MSCCCRMDNCPANFHIRSCAEFTCLLPPADSKYCKNSSSLFSAQGSLMTVFVFKTFILSCIILLTNKRLCHVSLLQY